MVGGISVWQLLILLLIVVLVFGTKRLRNIGSDLGSAVKGFRKGLEEVILVERFFEERVDEPGGQPCLEIRWVHSGDENPKCRWLLDLYLCKKPQPIVSRHSVVGNYRKEGPLR